MTSDKEVSQFAKAAVLSLLEHQFFCKNNRYVAECFFGDLKDAMDVDNSDLIGQANESNIGFINKGKRQYIFNLMECPICAKMILPDQYDAATLSPGMELLADNGFAELISSEDWKTLWDIQFKNHTPETVKFWGKCYFCMFGLLREALFMRKNEPRQDSENVKDWVEETDKVSFIYRRYLEQNAMPQIAVIELYQLYLRNQNILDEGEFIRSFYSEEQNTKPESTPTRILPNTFTGMKMDYESLMTNLRQENRYAPYKLQYYRVPGFNSLPLMFNEIILPKKNVCYGSSIFEIKNTQTRVDVTAPHKDHVIKFIANNYRDLLLHVAMLSAKNSDYRPFSYRKVHINTCKKNNIIPGEEGRFEFYLELSPIEFFDHLIVRNYLNNVYAANGSVLKEDREFFVRHVEMTTTGFKDTGAFYMMAGCGVWVVSSDNYLLVSRRSNVLEKPVNLGYSAAGSCEYSSRLKAGSNVSEYEANPFLTARRELFEECALDIPIEKLQLISFGIDYERYLQQFSFYFHSEQTADQLLELSKHAESSNEQVLFAIPFTDKNISHLIHTYEIEPGAVVSLIRLWEWLQ